MARCPVKLPAGDQVTFAKVTGVLVSYEWYGAACIEVRSGNVGKEWEPKIHVLFPVELWILPEWMGRNKMTLTGIMMESNFGIPVPVLVVDTAIEVPADVVDECLIWFVPTKQCSASVISRINWVPLISDHVTVKSLQPQFCDVILAPDLEALGLGFYD